MAARKHTYGLWPRHGLMSTAAGKRFAVGFAAMVLASFAFAALVVGLLGVLTESTGSLRHEVFQTLLIGILAGLGTVVITLLFLPLIGRVAGIPNDMRLLELSNPGSPLLRDLMETAPGTYNHSIMAGSLAERAAAEIGANPLLARVGAYYHDIGKTVRPVFFVENQSGRSNPHDIASPTQSAFIITAHVREGVDLAEKSRLPDDVVAIIRQHHGTSIVTCFYEKARQGDGPVLEADFRYDGERPQSREAALVMLADVAEAAARAIGEPTEARLRSTVRRCVDTKLADGQLSESHLTQADLDRTVDVYATMLMGVYHPRVAYPGDPEPKGVDHAGARDQSPRP
jgi:putative nucleotidyltransferase with HDIG domain